MKKLIKRRSVRELYNTSRQKHGGLDHATSVVTKTDGSVEIRYKQDLEGITSLGSMKDELDENGNEYEVRYLLKSVILTVSNPEAVTAMHIVHANLGSYPKGVFKRY